MIQFYLTFKADEAAYCQAQFQLASQVTSWTEISFKFDYYKYIINLKLTKYSRIKLSG